MKTFFWWRGLFRFRLLQHKKWAIFWARTRMESKRSRLRHQVPTSILHLEGEVSLQTTSSWGEKNLIRLSQRLFSSVKMQILIFWVVNQVGHWLQKSLYKPSCQSQRPTNNNCTIFFSFSAFSISSSSGNFKAFASQDPLHFLLIKQLSNFYHLENKRANENPSLIDQHSTWFFTLCSRPSCCQRQSGSSRGRSHWSNWTSDRKRGKPSSCSWRP